MNNVFDIIIIGAGPAGLFAGSILNKKSRNYLIIEKGQSIENRNANNPTDVAEGIGGAGLFSDGKLSFPPSGSGLWQELDPDHLKDAYIELSNLLKEGHIDLPQFNTEWVNYSTNLYDVDSTQKEYDSIELNEFKRNSILSYLYNFNKNHILTNTSVKSVQKTTKTKTRSSQYELVASTQVKYYARQLILATGKFGTRLLEDSNILEDTTTIDKLELGIRLEVPSSLFFPCSEKQIDFKKIESIDDNAEFRSFCCCKNGIVLASQFDRYVSYNGSTTPIHTKNSNIGLVIRSTYKKNKYYDEMKKFLSTTFDRFELPADKFINSSKVFIGENCDNYLKTKILDFTTPDALDASYIYGPEIEYIGNYASSEKNLQLSENIWLIGDITGRFRGLLPAMLSGIYCATKINANYDKTIQDYTNKLKVNTIPPKNMDLVFTAQSKKFFYCKEVICQYVLEKNKVPINPFMVFNYFLNDRVERDLIRYGNNQLISNCKELWVFGPIADGVLFEIVLAKKQNKKIRFFEIGTTIDEIKEITDLQQLTFEPEVHSKQIKKNDLISFIISPISNSEHEQIIRDKPSINNQFSLFDINKRGI